MHEKIKEQIKDAMRAKDALRLEVLRGLSAAFTNKMIADESSATVLSDEEVTGIIRKAVKQRKDSIEQFEKGGRKDLVKKERAELVILESFMPQMMSRDEIKKYVKAKMKSDPKSASVPKAKAGQFIGQIMKELKGKADGADVKIVVEELLD